MPDLDRVVRYLQIDRNPALPITLDGTNAGLAIVSRRNPALGNVSRLALQKNGADVTSGTLKGTIPAGSVFQIHTGFYELADAVSFQATDVHFDHTFALLLGGTIDLQGRKATTVYILANGVQAALDDQWLLTAAARNPSLPSDQNDGMSFAFEMAVGTGTPIEGTGQLLNMAEIMDTFTDLAFGQDFHLTTPARPGGLRIGGSNQAGTPVFGDTIDTTAYDFASPAEFRATLKVPLGDAVARLKSSLNEDTDDVTAVRPIRFAGDNADIGVRAWARLEDETLSETVDAEGQLQQIAESTWTINRSAVASTANLMLDDSNIVWEIVGLERLDRITDRIVCRRAVI